MNLQVLATVHICIRTTEPIARLRGSSRTHSALNYIFRRQPSGSPTQMFTTLLQLIIPLFFVHSASLPYQPPFLFPSVYSLFLFRRSGIITSFSRIFALTLLDVAVLLILRSTVQLIFTADLELHYVTLSILLPLAWQFRERVFQTEYLFLLPSTLIHPSDIRNLDTVSSIHNSTAL